MAAAPGAAATGPCRCWPSPARIGDMPVYLNGVGTAKARNLVTVRPQVDGRILCINFKEGQDVKRGDVLAKIDPATYQAQLDQAVAKKALDEAQLDNAKRDLERYSSLGGNVVAQKTIDTQRALVAQLTAQVKLDDAAIANAKAYLDYTTIVSPIDGRIGIRMVDEGNLVRASDAGLVVITEVRPIAVLFTLPQQQLDQVNQALRGGAGERRRPRLRRQDRARSRRAAGGRQPGRLHHRHDPHEGRVPQRQPAALAGAVRQRAHPDRHAEAGGGHADPVGAARSERRVRLCRAGRRQGRHAPGRRDHAERDRRRDRQGPCRRRSRRHHRLCPPQGRLARHRCQARGAEVGRADAKSDAKPQTMSEARVNVRTACADDIAKLCPNAERREARSLPADQCGQAVGRLQGCDRGSARRQARDVEARKADGSTTQ